MAIFKAGVTGFPRPIMLGPSMVWSSIQATKTHGTHFQSWKRRHMKPNCAYLPFGMSGEKRMDANNNAHQWINIALKNSLSFANLLVDSCPRHYVGNCVRLQKRDHEFLRPQKVAFWFREMGPLISGNLGEILFHLARYLQWYCKHQCLATIGTYHFCYFLLHLFGMFQQRTNVCSSKL